MAVMQQAVEHGTDGGDIAKQFAPVLDGTIGSEQRAETLVAAHDDFQQILGGGVREFAQPKSSMMSSGTVGTDSIYSLRLPSVTASASSSSRMCVSRYSTL